MTIRVGSSLAVLILLQSAVHAGTIGTTAVVPTTMSAGVGTAITVTAAISDPNVIAASVNLQQLDSAGRATVLASMYDDGTNGDVTAGDGIFTIQTNVFQPNPGSLTLRVSAGFKGSLLRAFSPVMTVTVVGTGTGISIGSPAVSAYLGTSPTLVTGVVVDPGAQVTVNGIAAQVSAGSFSASVPLQEGSNTLTAVAQNTNGTTSTDSRVVTLDTTPPHVTIDSPGNDTSTAETSVTVTGIVNDIVVGTVNDQQANVTVNGIGATVANRTFTALNVPLSLGLNTIQATGRDRAGNGATVSINITRQALTQPTLRLVSGNNLSGPIKTLLAAPLVARLLDGSGQPIPNTPVVFQVTGGDGSVSTGGPPGMSSIAVNTNAQGQAQVNFILGSRSGAGNNMVTASSAGVGTTAVFTESATPTAAAMIVVDSGNDQSGVVGQALPLPFIAIVTDAGHNRLGNVRVTFTIPQGGGTFNGQPSLVATSDSDGRVQAVLTLGPQEGVNNNQVQATFAGNSGLPAVFSASGKIPGPPQNTIISGVVLTNSGGPIPGVTMRLFQTQQGNNSNIPQQIGTPVVTDAQGFFQIQPAPVGVYKLMADGTTAGNYPTLEYDIVTVAGRNNTVGLPIYLPLLNPASQLCVSPTVGGTLTLPQAPGFALTIAPGSATFPGGARSGCVSVSPVNMDKIPMVPGFGQQPRFIVTIQPVGATFSPPAALTIPNVDGLAPRSVTEMYSYDHDLASFVAIGTGTVSADGSVISSDPGVGVLKAGWHCGGNPAANGTVADCPTCKICQNNACVADPAQDGSACPLTPGSGACVSGVCQPIEYDPGTGITESFSIPLTKNNIGVSPGEKVIFNMDLTDTDRKRRKGTAAWTNFDGTGPYVLTLTITGPASWDSAGSGTKTKTINSLSSGNAYMYADDPWPDGQTITVVAKVVDNATPPPPPDVGTTKDPDYTITWTLVKRTQCPTMMTTNAGVGSAPNTFVPATAVYAYDMGPALPPPLVFPYYQDQTILESFTTISAYQFTMNDLLAAFKTAHPTLTTPDIVAQFLWNSGSNGTFVIDNVDRIYDQHNEGPLPANVFTAAANAAGIGFNLPQVYSCGPNTVGNYIITARYTNGVQQINKQGP